MPLLLDAEDMASFRHDALSEKAAGASSRWAPHQLWSTCSMRRRCLERLLRFVRTVVIHQLTDLPPLLEPSRMAEGIARTTRYSH